MQTGYMEIGCIILERERLSNLELIREENRKIIQPQKFRIQADESEKAKTPWEKSRAGIQVKQAEEGSRF